MRPVKHGNTVQTLNFEAGETLLHKATLEFERLDANGLPMLATDKDGQPLKKRNKRTGQMELTKK
jgi:hypothetical protein